MTDADRIALHERMVRLEERERVLALLEEEAQEYDRAAKHHAKAHGFDYPFAREAAECAERLRAMCERLRCEEHWATKEGA